MSEPQPQPPKEILGAVAQQTIFPPVVSVSNVNIVVSAVEVSLTLGRLRQVVDTKTNVITPTGVIEWFQTVSLNPVVAKQLLQALSVSIPFYERKFGKIPEDPNFSTVVPPD